MAKTMIVLTVLSVALMVFSAQASARTLSNAAAGKIGFDCTFNGTTAGTKAQEKAIKSVVQKYFKLTDARYKFALDKLDKSMTTFTIGQTIIGFASKAAATAALPCYMNATALSQLKGLFKNTTEFKTFPLLKIVAQAASV